MITTQMTNQQKKDNLAKFLQKELGSSHRVKEFASLYRDLGICNLSDIKDVERVTDDGGAVLMTLVTWYSLGLTSKFIEIKNIIKRKDKHE